MTEYGVYRYCQCCKKSYHCTDGSYFCSDSCEDQWEARQCELEEDED